MKKFLLLLGVAVLGLTSCSKKAENLTVIPKEATVVLSFDVESLYKKADVKELQNLPSFQKLKQSIKKDNESFGKLLEEVLSDPKSSGIDLKTNIYNFYLLQGGDVVIGVTMALKSDSNFKDFVSKIYKSKGKELDIETVDGRKIVRIEEDLTLAWDGDKALLLTDFSNRSNYKENVNKFFSLKKDEQVTKVKGFDEFLSGEKDVNFWIDFETVLNHPGMGLLGSAYMSMMKLQKDTKVYGFVDFGKENIKATMHGLYGEEYAKLMKQYDVYDTSFNTEVLKYFPEKMHFAFAAAFNFKNYIQLMKSQFSGIVSDKEINRELAKEGLTQDNLNNLLAGSFTVGLVKLESHTYTGTTLRFDEDTYDYKWVEAPQETLLPIMNVALELKDKTLIDRLVEKGNLQKENGYYNLKDLWNSDLYMAYTDKMLFASNSAAEVEGFLAGGYSNNATNTELAKEASKSLMYAKLDLNIDNYPKALIEKVQDEYSFSVWKRFSESIVIKRVDNNTAEFVYNLKGVEKNILNSIFKAVDEELKDEY